MSNLKGIYVNGIPLDPDTSIDIEIHRDSFTFHYIHKPIKPRNFKPRALRRSPVREVPIDRPQS